SANKTIKRHISPDPTSVMGALTDIHPSSVSESEEKCSSPISTHSSVYSETVQPVGKATSRSLIKGDSEDDHLTIAPIPAFPLLSIQELDPMYEPYPLKIHSTKTGNSLNRALLSLKQDQEKKMSLAKKKKEEGIKRKMLIKNRLYHLA
ncbi:hypothetical protein ADUPG1_005728, partial [Aduncisulcus paluster]